ncbi:hypothetical protein SOVF_088340 [Spinacia oleracea]|nr:hypothetical protein SOVF_088340 [Spinacia oleracea]
MDVSFETALNSWLSSFGKLEKRELDAMHLGVLASSRFVKLNSYFLRAVVEVWDPANHACLPLWHQ